MKKNNLSPSTSILSLCLIAAIAALVFGVSMGRSRAAGSPIGASITNPQGKSDSSQVGRATSTDGTKGHSPLVGPVTVTATAGTLGPTDYATLKLAFDAINAGTHQGAITIDINGNTTETATAALNNSGAGSAVYTSVSITPSGGARTITGSIVGAIIKLNGADNVTIDGRIGGVGRNLTVSNSNTSTATAAIWLASVVAGNGASSNVIRNLEIAAGQTANTGTNSTFGIIQTGTTISTSATDGNDNDNNSFIANRIIRARYGIASRGVTTNNNLNPIITDNIIGPSSFGADEIGKAGIFMQADTGATISRNTVQFVGGDLANTTAGADRCGIGIGGENWSATDSTTITSGDYTVTKNIIHDIVEERTFSAIGIKLGTTRSGTPTNNLVANNFVYNIRANGTTGDQLCGIGISGGLTDRVVFNSISITGDMDPGATSVSTTYGNAIRIPGANAANNANFTVENNSIYLDVNSNTAANHYYAITLNSAAYVFGTGGLNYNNYFINAANPQLRTGGLGTGTGNTPGTEFATLANWQTALTTPQDANSIQADPLYFSNTSDLHILGTSPNVNVGLTIAGVADDIDAQARPNGANPDIGADEFYASPGTLQFSSATYSVTELAATVMITVTRTGGVNGAVQVDYATVAGGSAMGGVACTAGVDYLNASGTLMWADLDGASKSFTVTICNDGVFETSETVNLLLSNVMTATLGSPSSAVLTIANSTTFNGPVNVGTGENFPSLTNSGGVFEAINTGVVTANTTINITTDLTVESGTFALNEFAAGFTLKIQPSGGVARLVSGGSVAALIALNGADNVTIDGLNTGGNSLIIRGTNAGGASTILLQNDASNNTIQNCTVEGPALSGVILISTGSTTGNDNNVISNNVVRDRTDAAGVPFNGVLSAGSSATILNSNTQITNNQVINFNQGAILIFSNTENSTVTGNDVSQTASRTTALFCIGIQTGLGTNLISQNAVHDISASGASNTFGIFLADARSTTVSRNRIYNFPSVAGATGRISGIEFDGASGLPSSVNLVNNFVSIIPTVSTNQNVRGIYDFAFVGNTFTADFNSIYIGGTSSGTSASWALDRGAAAPTTYTARNNLCFNNRTGGGANHFAGGDDSANTGTFVSNFNFFAGTGTTAANFMDYGTVSGGTAVSFTTWQAGLPARDANSVANTAATYVASDFFVNQATGDLHLKATATPVLSVGTPVAGITTDIDNDPRPGSNPDIGADELVMAVAGVIPAGTYYNASANDGDTLGGDVTITNQLTLNGKLNTGAFTLTIGCNATVIGAGAGNYVIGNLKKTFCSTGAFDFVVGTANGFSPVAVNITAGTFPADFTTKAVQGPQPNIGSPTHALQRYWVLTATGVTADLTFNYLDPTDVPVTAVEGNFVIFKYNAGFTMPGGSVNTAANTATIAGVTSFSDWTLAEPNAPTAIELASVTGTEYDTGTYLEWKTGAEVRNLGFNIYRDEGGKRTQVNSQLIAGGALLAGSDTVLKSGKSYSWWISSSSSKSGAQYFLEDVDLSGQSTWHGPIGTKHVGGKPPTTSDAAVLSSVGVAESQAASSVQVTRSAALTRVAAGQIKLQSDLAGKQAVKISVRREGWYRVSQADLLAAGFNAKTDPDKLQMYVDGRQIPISVMTDQKQVSAVDFYGRGIDASYTDARVYWLVAGTQAGLRVQQVKGDGYPTPSRSFLYTVERRDRTIYFSSLRNGDKENFFGPVIGSNPVDQTLSLQHVDQASTEQAQLEISLQGVTQLPHRVWAYLNGTFAGELMFEGQSEGAAKLAVAQSLLRDGDNQVRLVAQGGPTDVSLLGYVRLGYFHGYAADNNALRFTATGGQAVTIGGFGSGAIRVLDVTDPDSVREVVGKVQQTGDGYSITVASQQPGERILVAGLDDQRSRPARVIDNRTSNLRSAEHAANFVIIANRDLISSVEPLRAKRAGQGFKVEVVDVEDIFDEFSFGNKSPDAMRDFLLYAQSGWKVAPQYVLLVGDASLDPKGYLGFADADLVPTVLIDTALLQTACDDALADFDRDGMPELMVGRLPVRSREEAARMIEKIVGYDQSASSGSVMLVADGNEEFDFEAASRALVPFVPGSLRVDVLNRGQMDPATARAQLIDAINRGEKVVNYLGHGSVNSWRAGLLTNEDAAAMNNGRLPLFVMMTCLNGYFQDPGLDSLAESLMKSRGGAVAVWASSGMTGPEGQAAVDRQVFDLIFKSGSIKGQPPTLGEAMLRAKRGVGDIDVRRTYILFGDPTTRLR